MVSPATLQMRKAMKKNRFDVEIPSQGLWLTYLKLKCFDSHSFPSILKKQYPNPPDYKFGRFFLSILLSVLPMLCNFILVLRLLPLIG